MNDPLEIFEAVYKEWRPPDRLEPRLTLFFWPALAGAATLAILFLTQMGPVKTSTDKPSSILVDQMAQVDASSRGSVRG